MINRAGEWHEKLRDSVINNPEGRAEYEAFGTQLNLVKKPSITQNTISIDVNVPKQYNKRQIKLLEN